MRVVRLLLVVALMSLAFAPGAAAATSPAPRSAEFGFVFPQSTAPSTTYVRVEGKDRVETAIAASKRAYWRANTVVLTTGWNWPDALGGSALAGAWDGPLLLTRPESLSSAVTTELVRLDAHRVIIIGSEGAVSSSVATQLAGLTVNGHGLSVERLGGLDRYETSAMVASATVERMRSRDGTTSGTAFFATGGNFPDALAASPVAALKGWPVMLVQPSGLPTATEDAVKQLGIRRAIVLGGTGVVATDTAGSLRELVGTAPERLAGKDRYVTAQLVARFGVQNGLAWDGVGVTTGENFPDALAGGVMQGKLKSVVLLTAASAIGHPAFDEIKTHRAAISTVRYIGGTGGLTQWVRDGVVAAMNGEPYPTHNGMVFPLKGSDYSYEDDFGDPRSGGRTHEGNDILAPRNTPELATLSGTITTKTNTLGGNVIYLDADNGWRFYYAHLDHWAVTSGHVYAGQVLGYVGNTGNAAGGPTHLHFQMWTPAGQLVDPYSYLQKMEHL